MYSTDGAVQCVLTASCEASPSCAQVDGRLSTSPSLLCLSMGLAVLLLLLLLLTARTLGASHARRADARETTASRLSGGQELLSPTSGHGVQALYFSPSLHLLVLPTHGARELLRSAADRCCMATASLRPVVAGPTHPWSPSSTVYVQGRHHHPGLPPCSHTHCHGQNVVREAFFSLPCLSWAGSHPPHPRSLLPSQLK